MKKIKKLPKELRKNGFEYTRVLNGKNAEVYMQHITDKIKAYEVFLKNEKPERIIFGKVYPKSEVFPPDEAFGVWAWSMRSYEAAKWRFDELESGKTRREFTKPGTNILIYK